MLIDTPGFNDPLRDDLTTLSESFKFMSDHKLDQQGLSAIVNVIQFPTGGRVTISDVEILMRYLSTLTLIYPDYDLEALEKGLFPKLVILFTGVSPYHSSRRNPNKPKKGDNVIHHSDLIQDQKDWVRKVMCHMIEVDNNLDQRAFAEPQDKLNKPVFDEKDEQVDGAGNLAFS